MSMTIDEMIAVLQAAKEGKTIQVKARISPKAMWGGTVYSPTWDFSNFDYRVKPQPREWWAELYNQSGLRGGLWATREEAASEGRKVVRVREIVEVEQ